MPAPAAQAALASAPATRSGAPTDRSLTWRPGVARSRTTHSQDRAEHRTGARGPGADPDVATAPRPSIPAARIGLRSARRARAEEERPLACDPEWGSLSAPAR